jgi:hypothetical protein
MPLNLIVLSVRGPYTTFGRFAIGVQSSTICTMHFAVNWRGRPMSKELFQVMPQIARARLEKLGPGQILNKPKIDRMFQDEEFAEFLSRLFSFTGILNWIDIQGAWTFTLFPSTSGGRYYTLNIGRHEVAFATLPALNLASERGYHSIVMDLLIRDFPDVRKWVETHNGDLRNGCLCERPATLGVGRVQGDV